MNILLTNRTTTPLSIVAPIYVENAQEKEFAAVMDGYFIYGWHSELINYTTVKREAIKEGEEISTSSPLGKVLTDPRFVTINRDRFLELLAATMSHICGEEHQ